MDWIEEAIGKQHDRASFNCGEPDLDLYLARYARQNHESGGAKTFVAVAADRPSTILGFYSLSPASLDYARTPPVLARKLGRYDVPMFRLGRLAVDRTMQGKGLGGMLLIAAAGRCIAVAEQVGGVALLIDAKHERAAKWYRGHGAIPLADAPLSLVLPLDTLGAAIESTR